MWTARSRVRPPLSRPMWSAPLTCSIAPVSIGQCSETPAGTVSASCMSLPTRSTARSAPPAGSWRLPPTPPNSPYAASKAASDHLARAWHHTYGLPVLTTNCSNNYGPYQFPEKLIPLAILKAVQGERIPIYGDGGNVRDWLYVTDHCRAIQRVLEVGRLGEVYNVGGTASAQPASHRHPLRPARRAGAGLAPSAPWPAQDIRPRPAGTRQALCHRRGQAASGAGMGAVGAFRERAAADPDLVSGKSSLVPTGDGRQLPGRAPRIPSIKRKAMLEME